MVFTFNHYQLEFLKQGKVNKHKTNANGKTYEKGKIYLTSAESQEKGYELYMLGEVCIKELFDDVNGKGILIFFPKTPRIREK